VGAGAGAGAASSTAVPAARAAAFSRLHVCVRGAAQQEGGVDLEVSPEWLWEGRGYHQPRVQAAVSGAEAQHAGWQQQQQPPVRAH